MTMTMSTMKKPKIATASTAIAAETMAAMMTAMTTTVTPAWLLRSSAAESLAPTGGRS
jgi:hypothetical protein